MTRIIQLANAAIAVLLGLALAASPAAAQSFNLDFNDAITGLPDSFGAASGQTGHWVDVPVGGTTASLTDVTGAITAAAITLEGTPAEYSPATTTAGILLRDDAFTSGGGFFSATLTGLVDGDYDLYYYHLFSAPGLTANGVPLNDLAGGSADEIGPQGTNWDVANVTVSGGQLEILDEDLQLGTGLSGIQLVAVPEPGTAALLGLAGLVLLRRRRG